MQQTSVEGSQSSNPQGQSKKTRSFSWKPLVIITIVLIALAITAVWILSGIGIIPTLWATGLSAIFAVLGVVVGLLPFLISPDKPEPTSIPISPIVVQVSPTQPPLPPPPQSPPLDKPPWRNIRGFPPPTDPRTIQQREKVVKELYGKLIQSDITAIVLTGIGGVGKSTLAALVYRYAEEQRRANNGPFAAEALWFRIDPTVTMADLAGSLSEAFGKSLSDFSSLFPYNQAMALFNILNTTDKTRLVVLDQFENLLDWQTGYALADRPGVAERLEVINSQQSRCRVLLTRRRWPWGTRVYPSTYMHEYPIQGLEVTEGIELLRKQGIKETQATEKELHTAVEYCEGHALSLTLLVSILWRNRSLTLKDLFVDATYRHFWMGDIASNLLDYIYTKQLNQMQRKLLLAFSVYREPVPLGAAQAIIASTADVSKEQIRSALDVLLTQHLLQALGEGRYQPHAIVSNYARWRSDPSDHEILLAEHTAAAQYYLQQATPGSNDVQPLIKAAWHQCQAQQWQAAYDLMQREGILSDSRRGGGNIILLESCQQLLSWSKWQPEHLRTVLIYYSLGWICDDLGKKEEAAEYYKSALSIFVEVGDRGGEGRTLYNLGQMYDDLGKKEEALKYYELALSAFREIGDGRKELATLYNLGKVYYTLKKVEEALKCYVQTLGICRMMGEHREEGITLRSMGELYLEQRRYDVALASFLLARGIFQELQNSLDFEDVQAWIDALHDEEEVGEKQFASLLARVKPQAQQIVEQALHEEL